MVGGFNHNFSYKGHTYHVQTEDSGVPRARITTLLYRAGTIIAREISEYADICKQEDMPSRVEEMMKGQHRSMLKNLKAGMFDAKIARLDTSGTIPTEVDEVDAPEMKRSCAEEVAPDVREAAAPAPGSRWKSRTLENKVKSYLDVGR
jgi:hypothetical protein